MTVLILSDIHANLEALEAVLADAGDFDRVWFLGDAVGYGPDPNACVERLMELEPEFWLAGNHDWAALGRIDVAEFNPDARLAVTWTGRQLTETVRSQLDRRGPRIDLPDDTFTLVHGSPQYPIWEYILNAGTAAENFGQFDAQLCLYGHTHVPAIFEKVVDGVVRVALAAGDALDPNGARWLVNPGSVGQPRDGDPRASYLQLELESGRLTLHRATYDIRSVQSKILAAGLPARLAARLDYGW